MNDEQFVKVVLPITGNHAVYEVREGTYHTAEFARMYGRQIAVRFGDTWIHSGRRAWDVDCDTAARFDTMPITE